MRKRKLRLLLRVRWRNSNAMASLERGKIIARGEPTEVLWP
jgi:hypothetical protein